MHERDITQRALELLNAHPQTRAVKTHGSGYSAGQPDIIGAHRGTIFALELKTATGKPSPLQLHNLKRWDEAGARVGIARNPSDALGLAIGKLTTHPATYEVEEATR